MKVVYAYADWSRKGEHDLHNEVQIYGLISSLLSWIKFAPNFTRVLYADSTILSFLKQKNLLDLWDEIEEVDFIEELEGKYGVNFFAYPKIWTWTRQTEPFWICDTDTVLIKPLCEWFDPTKYWSQLYDHSIKPDLHSRGKQGFFEVASNLKFPSVREFCNWTKCSSAGLIFFPEPKIAQILGHTILSIAKDIRKGSPDLNWVLYEEALIPSILETMGRKMTAEPEGVRIELCEMGSLKEFSFREEQVTTALGFNPKDWYPELF